jgi:[histone H3]-lysine36 N-dimethyltransferase SETMAR
LKGVILKYYLPVGQMYNGEDHVNLLNQLREKINANHRGMVANGVLILQDNEPAHTSHTAMTAAQGCGYKILPHPPYLPDIAPSGFSLFPMLKKDIRGKHFKDNDELITAGEGWFSGQPEVAYDTGLLKLNERWEKCVALQGDYVEMD